jgi:hypothetical protein
VDNNSNNEVDLEGLALIAMKNFVAESNEFRRQRIEMEFNRSALDARIEILLGKEQTANTLFLEALGRWKKLQ